MGDQDGHLQRRGGPVREGGFRGLRVTNTLTGRKEDFVPLDPENVRMYVCGPTVYDFAHIGNARPAIVFDVLYRLLRHLYGEEHVTYVRNITDVDDKIILRAAEEYSDLPLNEAIRKVTETTEKQYHEDVAALGCLTQAQVNKPGEPPRFIEPRATEHIGEMVAMIKMLVDEGHAYAADGHVLFDVKSWKAADGSLAYGKLSRRSLDDMIAGARVEVAPYKRDPMDFVLWKPSKPGEPVWESPWGPGRPGWHIECSAMADRWLWQEALPRLSENAKAHPHQFDIHGGGIDLVFPHHENEIAQSRCANHTERMARYWMHNGFLQVEGRKMAKSEGNFVTIRDLLETETFGGLRWNGSVLRFAMLTTHYRQPIDWTANALQAAFHTLDDWFQAAGPVEGERPSDRVVEALSDDLNTPQVIAELHQLRKKIRINGEGSAAQELAATLAFLGFDRVRFFAWLDELDRAVVGDAVQIETLICERAAARKAKNFAEADRIRDELDAMGIQLKDSKDPKTGELVTTWEVKR
jgi:cysteinyl-tRNA synthetase